MTVTPDTSELGTVPDHKHFPRKVVRDCDGLDLSAVGTLLPGGVRALEDLIADYWTDLARWRAANLDLQASGIDLDECREALAGFIGTGDPADFTSIDWHEIGLRLERLRAHGGYRELRRLHELLTGENPGLAGEGRL